ncbi:non-homologous end joining protein Ku [Vulcanimicrobium alpinum]|uniref:Non-homologous end joining protein Ku n=1 Tax=Vulcanimicrobium alpinum TaxID=3016050 RepID=A0AAN1Y0U2_UNVUL|nr:non-homologous end joining protein Ku [Vulcanimicrobium alpinum]
MGAPGARSASGGLACSRGYPVLAHAIWSGAINFGLVTIPVKLYTAVRTNDLRFNFLHKKDDGRIFNERHCTVCGEKVEYADLVRGYEYEKGRYVTITDDDLKAVRPEATQSVQIVQFVELDQINPMYFDTPYYLEPEKKGRHAYALLRDALKDAGKVAIASVVIRSREHLAAVKPNGEALVLELMHFADEMVSQGSFDFPALSEHVAEAEKKVAKMLIDTMSIEAFDPEQFHDKYREDVLAMIEARAAGESVEAPEIHKPAATNVVNLMDVLQRSLEQSKARRASGGSAAAEDDAEEERPAKKTATARKKSANAAKPKAKRKKSAA